jgi:hypothetical protein
MNSKLKSRRYLCVAMLCLVLALEAVPAEAQREYEPLFDKFNFQVEASWVNISSEIRLDSEILGEGTTVNFENLGLAADKTIPTLAFQWQIGKRHRVGVRWQDIKRTSTTHVEEDIQWGDVIIPVDATLSLDFDVTQYFVDYAFYPWVKENWAAGFGLGFRWMDLSTTLAWEGLNVSDDGRSQSTASGPLPYLYFEYRRLFSDHWRFMTGVGWLSVKVGDIDGTQWVGRVGIEYLAGRWWSFGAGFNLATVDVEWAGIEVDQGNLLDGSVNWDIKDISVFARVRF